MSPRPIRVLLVDDDEGEQLVLRRLLSGIHTAPFHLDWLGEYEPALRMLGEAHHDVCLVDSDLGEHDGLDLVRTAIRAGCQAPFILLTAAGSDEVQSRCLKEGVADFLVKHEFNSSVLERCIRRAIELKRARKALRESERRCHLLAESARDMISRESGQGVYLYVSPACRTLLGYAPEDLVGHSVEELCRPRDWRALQESYRRLEATDEPQILNYRARRCDGTDVWLERTSRLLGKEATGQAGQIIAVSRDVTQLRALEDQLVQSQKLEGLGKLTAGVAHEFNNVLTAILGTAQLMLTKERREQWERSVNEICDLAEQAAGFTQQLLVFCREQPSRKDILDLGELAQRSSGMLQRLIGDCVQLSCSCEPKLGHVRADRNQIQQVILNLALNARDAMPAGGRLTLKAKNVILDRDYARSHSDVTPGPYVTLTVSDTGCGMDQATRQRIFDPFFTTKEIGLGTGLGLTTVDRIVRRHQGCIGVRTHLGEGTTFEIHLPRVDAAVEDPGPQSDQANNRLDSKSLAGCRPSNALG